MLCGDRSLVNYVDGAGAAISLRCRAWTCEYCAPARRLQLIALARSGNADRFITLTVNPAFGISPADRAARLARAWRIVVARARRQISKPAEGRWPIIREKPDLDRDAQVRAYARADDAAGRVSIHYLAVFEATKAGEPHLHILARAPYIPQEWLSQQMRQIAGSPIVDIRKVKSNQHAAHYVTKYVGKRAHRFATCKRYWRTTDWAPATETPDVNLWGKGGWVVSEKSVFALLHEWSDYGKAVEFDQSLDWAYYGRGPPWLVERAERAARAMHAGDGRSRTGERVR